MSKGSGRRPLQIPNDKFAENWDRIFGKKKDDKKEDKKQN